MPRDAPVPQSRTTLGIRGSPEHFQVFIYDPGTCEQAVNEELNAVDSQTHAMGEAEGAPKARAPSA